nr:hypothetical protein [Tanacetum cinerariifolium]
MLNNMDHAEEIENMLEIKVYEAASQKEIFSSEAWRRVFDINEPIYTKLCHEFYSTYEFNEVCADDELKTKKVNEEGFDVYFQGGLCDDENLNATDYWLSISTAEELHLSRCLNYRESYFLIMKIVKKIRVLTDEMLNSLSALTYYRALDTTTLREMIDSKGRLIPKVLTPRVLGVAVLEARDHLCRIYINEWVAWRFVKERLRGCLIGSHITRIGIMMCLSIWLEFTMFHFRVLITYLVMISSRIIILLAAASGR